MTEVERYTPQRADVDSWTQMLGPVADLAGKIGGTAFVPDSLRGNTAAVAAAILTGREMNLGPMTSLRHIHVIKGRPGQSAELMRALVLSRGHKIRYVETTDTRCVVEGRRCDEQDWTRVMFTADQAKRAKIDLGGYPEDKLVARATARLCRRIFADVVAGMPYTTDELEDLNGAEPRTEVTAEPASPKRRTAQRKTKTTQDEPAGQEAGEPPPRVNAPPPPLPGEDEQSEPITKPQLTKLHTVFSALQVAERETRLQVASMIVNRELGSSTELTKDEASTLIDTLDSLAAGDNGAARLWELLNVIEKRKREDDDVTDAEIVETES